MAVARHSTLPWSDEFAAEMTLRATPLREAQLGRRDRLSILAQFAAHQGFLRFSGVADGEVDPAEWCVIQKRGTDSRLVRIAARPADPGAVPPALMLAQQFAEAIEIPPLEVFRQSSARMESVFIECFRRLIGDAAADLRWTRRSAVARLCAPGPETLRDIAGRRQSRFTWSDESVISSLENYDSLDPAVRVVVLRGRAMVRYGALENLGRLGLTELQRMSETDIVERLAAILPAQHVVFAVVDPASFDAASERVMQMLMTTCEATWVVPDEPAQLPRSRWYFVAPRIAAARDAESQLANASDPEAIVSRFLSGGDLTSFLERGVLALGDSPLRSVKEPERSYVAALALLGESIPRPAAESFLREFLCERPLDDLVVRGVSRIENERYCFESAAAQRGAARLIPAASRNAICRVAASVSVASGDPTRAATLMVEAGEPRQAVEILARVEWTSDAGLIEACDSIPWPALATSQPLALAYARALVAAARYREAREVAASIDGDARDLVLAHVERRTGDYSPAMTRLERLGRSCEADLLRAEILSVERRDVDAVALLQSCAPETDDQRARHDYLRALVSEDYDVVLPDAASTPYFTARLATYRALEEGHVDDALIHIKVALDCARTTVDRIDVLMDHVFTLFSAGRWQEARHAALEALAEVEETQGDRAAGGLLFLLAYLAADDGQWAHASQRTTRLRHFYGATKDARRLAELDLLAAHLAFARGRFDEAQRIAEPLVSSDHDEPIRIAAALIVDESNWISGHPTRSALTREPLNAEFADRWRMNAGRAGTAPAPPPQHAFNRDLLEWERNGGKPPRPTSGSERLKLFRAAVARSRQYSDRDSDALARHLAAECGATYEARVEAASDMTELALLRSIALSDYPFAPHAFDRHWRHAIRNRLGQWQEAGSAPPLGRDALDSIAASQAKEWIALSDRELLQFAGCERWPAESRDAVAAAFRNRAELHRLRRIVDQDQNGVRTKPTVAGIIGDSQAIRDVVERALLIARRDVAVCIQGESGTGKELIARAIHGGSPRRSKTFTPINCGALPENLIESELFGHVRGAFTGADRDRAGLIEITDGGTLFLDEIGEMPLAAQAKLLRFLQEGEFRRVGDTSNRSADLRIVAATNQKLDQAVEQGRFREDLYYRIAGVEILLPPLRERGNDVLALATHFLDIERERQRGGPSRFSSDVESIFVAYSWPGNVRELQNAVRGAHAVAADAKEVAVEHLPEKLKSIVAGKSVAGSYQDAVAHFRRDLIETALKQSDGNQNRAATMLKLSRQALGYQIRELGIMVGRKRARAGV